MEISGSSGKYHVSIDTDYAILANTIKNIGEGFYIEHGTLSPERLKSFGKANNHVIGFVDNGSYQRRDGKLEFNFYLGHEEDSHNWVDITSPSGPNRFSLNNSILGRLASSYSEDFELPVKIFNTTNTIYTTLTIHNEHPLCDLSNIMDIIVDVVDPEDDTKRITKELDMHPYTDYLHGKDWIDYLKVACSNTNINIENVLAVRMLYVTTTGSTRTITDDDFTPDSFLRYSSYVTIEDDDMYNMLKNVATVSTLDACTIPNFRIKFIENSFYEEDNYEQDFSTGELLSFYKDYPTIIARKSENDEKIVKITETFPGLLKTDILVNDIIPDVISDKTFYAMAKLGEDSDFMLFEEFNSIDKPALVLDGTYKVDDVDSGDVTFGDRLTGTPVQGIPIMRELTISLEGHDTDLPVDIKLDNPEYGERHVFINGGEPTLRTNIGDSDYDRTFLIDVVAGSVGNLTLMNNHYWAQHFELDSDILTLKPENLEILVKGYGQGRTGRYKVFSGTRGEQIAYWVVDRTADDIPAIYIDNVTDKSFDILFMQGPDSVSGKIIEFVSSSGEKLNSYSPTPYYNNAIAAVVLNLTDKDRELLNTDLEKIISPNFMIWNLPRVDIDSEHWIGKVDDGDDEALLDPKESRVDYGYGVDFYDNVYQEDRMIVNGGRNQPMYKHYCYFDAERDQEYEAFIRNNQTGEVTNQECDVIVQGSRDFLIAKLYFDEADEYTARIRLNMTRVDSELTSDHDISKNQVVIKAKLNTMPDPAWDA